MFDKKMIKILMKKYILDKNEIFDIMRNAPLISVKLGG